MELITTVNVSGQGFYSEKAVGRLLAVAPGENGSILISAEYIREDGSFVKIIKSNSYTAEEVQELYLAIKPDLTEDLNGVLALWEQATFAMKIKMAQTFSINVNQIEKI